MTARAWPPDPPCACFTLTVWPVFAFQYLMNAALKSWYSSRVGSYDVLRRLCAAAVAAAAESAAPTRATRRSDVNAVIEVSSSSRHRSTQKALKGELRPKQNDVFRRTHRAAVERGALEGCV